MTMAVANTQTTMPLTDLVPTLPETSGGATNPAAVYLAGLAKTGQTGDGGATALGRHYCGDAERRGSAVAPDETRTSGCYPHTGRRDGQVAATINLMLTAIRGVCRSAWNMGLMTSDELARLEAVKNIKAVVEPTGRRITAGELAAIMAGIKTSTPAGKRDAAIIALAYCGGLRRREIASLWLEDVRETGEAMEVVVKSGKGRKDRHLFIDNGGADALRSYLASVETLLGYSSSQEERAANSLKVTT